MAPTEDYLSRLEQRVSRLEALIEAGALPRRAASPAAQPLVRIGSLVVVGAALYVGGALYKRLAGMESWKPVRD